MTWELMIALVATLIAIAALVVALVAWSSVRVLRQKLHRVTALQSHRSSTTGRHAAREDGASRKDGTSAAQQDAPAPSDQDEDGTPPYAQVPPPAGAGRDVGEQERAQVTERPAHAAVILNPTKGHPEDLRSLVVRTTEMLGLPEPKFYETTKEDTGTGQARQAVEQGAEVVIAAGGDGTVRAVAEGLAHTDVPLGLLPQGTGNLLATNLGLNGTTDREQLTIALTGRNRPMDIGILRAEALTEEEKTQLGRTSRDDTFGIEAPTDGVETTFVVIGGMGFDAVMVGGVPEALKARIGIAAYPIHALRHLFDHRVRARVALNAANYEPVTDPDAPGIDVTARSVMFANCGRLMSGVTLVPGAQIDDGWLDIVVMDTRGGIKGWADLSNKVLLQGSGHRGNLAVLKDGVIESNRARACTVRTRRPHPVQVDGDIVALATTVYAKVVPDALQVRVAY